MNFDRKSFFSSKPVIGMVHLPALPGSPGSAWSLDRISDWSIGEAVILRDGGVDALMIENYGDAPFFREAVPPVTVAVMARLVSDIRRAVGIPVGVNVLRNDAMAAMAVACAAGASFIRVNVLSGARLTDQGIIQGQAAELLRLRAALDAQHIGIFADYDVKHSAALAVRTLEEEVSDLVCRGKADAVIVSGAGTGLPADAEVVRKVSAVAGVPVLLGSGVSVTNLDRYQAASGFIVGSSLKNSNTGDTDKTKVADLVRVRNSLRG